MNTLFDTIFIKDPFDPDEKKKPEFLGVERQRSKEIKKKRKKKKKKIKQCKACPTDCPCKSH